MSFVLETRSVSEMPHLEPGEPGAERLGTVDLRVELYPISSEKKRELIRAVNTSGVVGEIGEVWFKFGPQSVTLADDAEVSSLPHLPDGWRDHMKSYLGESRVPRMVDVFV